MLANCGTLGLDPADVSLSGYLEAVEVNNEASGAAPKPEPSDFIRNLVNGEGPGNRRD